MDELEIARQLTISESKLFYSIRPKELLNQAWSRRDGNEKSLHVLALINRFNVVSQWVTLMVIESDKIKNRARILEKMIKIALKLRELNNFNTLMSFIGGLNNPAISRLKWTRARIKKKSLDDLENLEKLMAMEGSYRNYRMTIRASTPPNIPYIGVYLTDLVFIEDGNADFIEGLINFGKRKLVHHVITELLEHQRVAYNFIGLGIPFLEELNTTHKTEIKFRTDQEMFDMSLKNEPRNVEKASDLL